MHQRCADAHAGELARLLSAVGLDTKKAAGSHRQLFMNAGRAYNRGPALRTASVAWSAYFLKLSVKSDASFFAATS